MGSRTSKNSRQESICRVGRTRDDPEVGGIWGRRHPWIHRSPPSHVDRRKPLKGADKGGHDLKYVRVDNFESLIRGPAFAVQLGKKDYDDENRLSQDGHPHAPDQG